MEKAYLIALHAVPEMTSSKLKLIIKYFGSAESAWNRVSFWAQVPNLKNALNLQGNIQKYKIDPENQYEKFLAAKCNVVCYTDENYPESLKHIYNPPYVLFYKGRLPRPESLKIAMIGARKCTAYGLKAGKKIAYELAGEGAVVVSGMARGIDGACHQGALDAGGETVAVLGCGVDYIYPREHKKLYHDIILNGVVMSEFPLGTKPLGYNFPKRNRIISGLSSGVVVVEAGLKSGTLITVDHGLEQGKDIFAIPGPITSPNSQGTHSLIKKQNAKLVEKGADVLEEYNVQQLSIFKEKQNLDKSIKPKLYTDEEYAILRNMAIPRHFDELLRENKMTAEELAPLLTVWEIRGIVKQLPGKFYITDSLEQN